MIELKDFRGKITPETDCVLEAESRATGRERSEIVREILHAWANKKIDIAKLIDRGLVSEGLSGIAGGASRNGQS